MQNISRRLPVLTLLVACCLPLPSISAVLKKTDPILVVDDDATNRRNERTLLSQMGYTNIEESADGVGALKKLRERKFALIISDWNMEPMTGLQLVKEVRADTKLKSTPFIMVTTQSPPDQMTMAKQAGANNHITKPFNAQTLGQTIDATFNAIK